MVNVRMQRHDADVTLETLQDAATATGTGTPINVKGYKSVSFDVAISNTATVTFQGTIAGSTWRSIPVRKADGTVVNTAVDAAGSGIYSLAGDFCYDQVRTNITAYTNGTVTVQSLKAAR